MLVGAFGPGQHVDEGARLVVDQKRAHGKLGRSVGRVARERFHRQVPVGLDVARRAAFDKAGDKQTEQGVKACGRRSIGALPFGIAIARDPSVNDGESGGKVVGQRAVQAFGQPQHAAFKLEIRPGCVEDTRFKSGTVEIHTSSAEALGHVADKAGRVGVLEGFAGFDLGGGHARSLNEPDAQAIQAHVTAQFRARATFKAGLARPNDLRNPETARMFASNGPLCPHFGPSPPLAMRFQQPLDTFTRRHIGPREADVSVMLGTLGLANLDELVERTVPKSIRLGRELDEGVGLQNDRGEVEMLAEMRSVAQKNHVLTSFIGAGYYGTVMPAVIQRNVLENPGWYTQYTPYQAEISQGRLEALLNFQTVVSDLTGLPMAGASLLDEATAAAEAMTLCLRAQRNKGEVFFVSERCFPQTIAVVKTRAEMAGIRVVVGDAHAFAFESEHGHVFGALVQYPDNLGRVDDFRGVIERAHAKNCMVVMAADILALTLLESPGSLGADVAVGSTQRFGVPMGFGGPHAGFLATSDEYKRFMPGRLIGMSRDVSGAPALRMAMQTREQHIRRDKATSNICTSQVLLANLAGFYAVYHGPAGLKAIAERVFGLTATLKVALGHKGVKVSKGAFFDTLHVEVGDARALHERAHASGLNLRDLGPAHVGITLDEAKRVDDVVRLFGLFGGTREELEAAANEVGASFEAETPEHARTTAYLTHPVFHKYHSEHEMLRYMRRLEARDLSLTTSMISLGSCTMKLNASSEMLPISWPELANMHPHAPSEQTAGYQELIARLDRILC